MTKTAACTTILIALLLSACEDQDIDNGIAKHRQDVSRNLDKVPITTALEVEPASFPAGAAVTVKASFEGPAAPHGVPGCDQPDEYAYLLSASRLTESGETIPYASPVGIKLPATGNGSGSQQRVDFGSLTIPSDFPSYTIDAGRPSFKTAPILNLTASFYKSVCVFKGNNTGTSEPEVAIESSTNPLVENRYRYTCGADGTSTCVYKLESQ